MTKRLSLTLITALLIVNVVALFYISFQYSSSIRTTVFQPSDEINEFGYSEATASQEQALQNIQKGPQDTTDIRLNTADCKVTLSDCRLTCQAASGGSNTGCFTDCEQSWQFCTQG